MITIQQATTSGQFAEVAKLMRSFIAWHYERHAADRHIINSYFDPQAFEAELEGLPGYFAPPRGRLLIAVEGDKTAGCVALRDLGSSVCEMKRMFVDPGFQGRGIGQMLAEHVIREARAIGYGTMRLDTGPAQREAQALYRKMGFEEIPPYYDVAGNLRDWLIFMELGLQSD
jgi:ribosomal protein S18 acetylase RimI-like enzyme